jgi:decaprenylphospho-beta-D-erythro-pentofuranosid-2-ulose 2-reductase
MFFFAALIMKAQKTVLVLGANSDVAREMILIYASRGYNVIAASRSMEELKTFVKEKASEKNISVQYFDAAAFDTHEGFYRSLPVKPHIVVYAAGYLVQNHDALRDWNRTFQMMKVHYCGAVSILNIIACDTANTNLEQIIGLSSLSGVRGRKSNFIYGSTKSAFTQYLAGLRQHLFPRKIKVNVIVAGYIRSKMTAGLNLPESLMLEPAYIADASVNCGNSFITVPGIKWKLIYNILRAMPESLVARLP